MKSENVLEGFLNYLLIDRMLSENTINSYEFDLQLFFIFLNAKKQPIKDVNKSDLQQYLAGIYDQGFAMTTVSRHLSTIHAFYNYLLILKVELVKIQYLL